MESRWWVRSSGVKLLMIREGVKIENRDNMGQCPNFKLGILKTEGEVSFFQKCPNFNYLSLYGSAIDPQSLPPYPNHQTYLTLCLRGVGGGPKTSSKNFQCCTLLTWCILLFWNAFLESCGNLLRNYFVCMCLYIVTCKSNTRRFCNYI